MGCVVIAGGFTGLRLPETLHHRLPQTLEEGEEFGKNWDINDCMRCIPIEQESSLSKSYEDFTKEDEVNIELNQAFSSINEATPLERKRLPRRHTMKKLARQQSVMATQKTGDLGSMQLTYWF